MIRSWLRLVPPAASRAPAARRTRLAVHPLEDRASPSSASSAFLATDLISDQPGVAAITDPTLVNAWGISLSPTAGGFWVSANGADRSEVYLGDVNGSPLTQPFKVATPGGKPTGQVFNNTGSPTDFQVTDGTNTKPAVFLFASEAGAVTGWNPQVGVAAGANPPAVTAGVGFQATDGAIYKGLALAANGGANFLYATDFHNGKIDVLDGQFHKVPLGQGGFGTFTDPNLPRGYAPFGIAAIDGKLYVSFAKQDAGKEDDVAGKGNGLIDVFDTAGHFQKRLVTGGDLNSAWGMVKAPPGFGLFGGALLVGNFGNGRIFAYDPNTGKELGTLSAGRGQPVVIDGLWGLAFGNGVSAGDANTLYYAAGPGGEAHGLFGKITAAAAGTNPVTAVLTGGDLVITGSRDSDRVVVTENATGTALDVTAGGQRIGRFDPAAVGTIHFRGFAGDDVFTATPRVTAAVFADGGAGDDTLVGGGGNNVMTGGAGRDHLTGGGGRNVLLGGGDRDTLTAGAGDSVLVGGTTAFDGDPAALLQILTGWTAAASYNDRVAALKAGTNGVPKLDPTAITDAGARDDLFAGPGLDWFVTEAPDAVHGGQPNEKTN